LNRKVALLIGALVAIYLLWSEWRRRVYYKELARPYYARKVPGRHAILRGFIIALALTTSPHAAALIYISGLSTEKQPNLIVFTIAMLIMTSVVGFGFCSFFATLAKLAVVWSVIRVYYVVSRTCQLPRVVSGVTQTTREWYGRGLHSLARAAYLRILLLLGGDIERNPGYALWIEEQYKPLANMFLTAVAVYYDTYLPERSEFTYKFVYSLTRDPLQLEVLLSHGEVYSESDGMFYALPGPALYRFLKKRYRGLRIRVPRLTAPFRLPHSLQLNRQYLEDISTRDGLRPYTLVELTAFYNKPRCTRVRPARYHYRAPSDCPICTESILSCCTSLRLPCRHWYHTDCIQAWIDTQYEGQNPRTFRPVVICPMCRDTCPIAHVNFVSRFDDIAYLHHNLDFMEACDVDHDFQAGTRIGEAKNPGPFELGDQLDMRFHLPLPGAPQFTVVRVPAPSGLVEVYVPPTLLSNEAPSGWVNECLKRSGYQAGGSMDIQSSMSTRFLMPVMRWVHQLVFYFFLTGYAAEKACTSAPTFNNYPTTTGYTAVPNTVQRYGFIIFRVSDGVKEYSSQMPFPNLNLNGTVADRQPRTCYVVDLEPSVLNNGAAHAVATDFTMYNDIGVTTYVPVIQRTRVSGLDTDAHAAQAMIVLALRHAPNQLAAVQRGLNNVGRAPPPGPPPPQANPHGFAGAAGPPPPRPAPNPQAGPGGAPPPPQYGGFAAPGAPAAAPPPAPAAPQTVVKDRSWFSKFPQDENYYCYATLTRELYALPQCDVLEVMQPQVDWNEPFFIQAIINKIYNQPTFTLNMRYGLGSVRQRHLMHCRDPMLTSEFQTFFNGRFRSENSMCAFVYDVTSDDDGVYITFTKQMFTLPEPNTRTIEFCGDNVYYLLLYYFQLPKDLCYILLLLLTPSVLMCNMWTYKYGVVRRFLRDYAMKTQWPTLDWLLDEWDLRGRCNVYFTSYWIMDAITNPEYKFVQQDERRDVETIYKNYFNQRLPRSIEARLTASAKLLAPMKGWFVLPASAFKTLIAKAQALLEDYQKDNPAPAFSSHENDKMVFHLTRNSLIAAKNQNEMMYWEVLPYGISIGS
jgi:hypothetical protein